MEKIAPENSAMETPSSEQLAEQPAISVDPRLQSIAANQPYPLLFATVSGAHLYGFPSPDSDYDLRGVHILPLSAVVGLDAGQETIEGFSQPELELDLVTHDVKKFFLLLLKRNGYVLEQLYSPLVVFTTPEHEELKTIAQGCMTRYHSHHYLGFAQTQWRLFEKAHPRRVKPLLYVYRVLLTGIYLMKTGKVESNLNVLNQEFQLRYLPDLIARKQSGAERSSLPSPDISFHEQEFHRLCLELETASRTTTLPDSPTAYAALNDLLVRLRLAAT